MQETLGEVLQLQHNSQTLKDLCQHHHQQSAQVPELGLLQSSENSSPWPVTTKPASPEFEDMVRSVN